MYTNDGMPLLVRFRRDEDDGSSSRGSAKMYPRRLGTVMMLQSALLIT